MLEDKTFYFDVVGMTCTACSSTIVSVLESEKYVKEIKVNLATNRAIVVVSKDTSPQTVIKAIEELGFKAFWIDDANDKTLHYALLGLENSQEADKIQKILRSKKEYIKNCEVNFSTQTATITTCVRNDKVRTDAIIQQIKKDIQSAGKKISPRLIRSITTDDRGQKEHSLYLRKAIINALAGVPLILLSGFIPLPLTFTGQLVGLLIGGATLGVMWQTGKEFYQGAWREFVDRRSSNMNTLIALGTGSAWFYSMLLILAPALFPVAALQYQFLAVNMILGIVNLGKCVRAYAQEQTKNKVQKLAQVYVNLQPQIARRVKGKYTPGLLDKVDLNKHIEQINYLEIQKGDIILVDPNVRFPVEGIILNKVETVVDQETLTGEAKYCNKGQGDEVYSGSLNTKNPVLILATRNGADGQLTSVIKDVDKSTTSKTSISKLVDRLAVVFVPTIIGVAALTALGWFFLGPVPVLPWIIKSTMSVLLCACPCALGLATPISTTISMYKQFNMGILVHDASALEAAANIDTVVFDKTGTLTKPVVNDVFISGGPEWNKTNVMQYVASLEKAFDHPIAKSFVAENSFVDLLPCSEQSKDAQGVSGKVNGKSMLVGSLSHLQSKEIRVRRSFKDQEARNAEKGLTSVYVAIDGKCVAVVGLKHDIRSDAKKTIRDLQKRNIDVFMLTGDKKEPATSVAKVLGIKKIYAEHTSEMKAEFITKLKNKGRCVAMVGDGINDLQAVRAADLGIAVGSWTHASSAAHVAIQRLNIVPMLIIAKETMKNIHQNLYWTGFYNLLSLTAATGLLYPLFGFVLHPVIASVSMGLSSIFVVVNSSRLGDKINYAVDIFEGKLKEPTTFIEKIKHSFSFSGLFSAFEVFFSFNKEIPTPTDPDPEPEPYQEATEPNKGQQVIFSAPRRRAGETFQFNVAPVSPLLHKVNVRRDPQQPPSSVSTPRFS
ncbi:MAG: copper-translocating P-type ATPase [Gammaproteobacteria bacterium 39-13]|nr:heavy metal translocating P-type ATPase [Gammaproteobacteria bacterium]OJV94952.1 MAG: copper-translocating P-type ATPase [Gammaproteobacteria bacterium 39-13]